MRPKPCSPSPTPVSPVSDAGGSSSMTGSPRKSTLVRMGTKVSTEALFREKLRLQDVSVCDPPPQSPPPSGAYVLDTSVKSVDESLMYNSGESISHSLAERFNQLPSFASSLPSLPSFPSLPSLPSSPIQQQEIIVNFSKDPDGSLGILIARGIRGGIYLMGLTPNGPAQRQTSLKPGDRIVSVNGVGCDDLDYSQVIDQLRRIPRDIELRVLVDHLQL